MARTLAGLLASLPVCFLTTLFLHPSPTTNQQARSQGTIIFKVVPITERPVHSQTMVSLQICQHYVGLGSPAYFSSVCVRAQLYVRAMADYCPLQDPAIPCADAGVSFKRGDILEIVDQSDALWWQAKTLPSHTACAGLVPSSSLLRRSVKITAGGLHQDDVIIVLSQDDAVKVLSSNNNAIQVLSEKAIKVVNVYI